MNFLFFHETEEVVIMNQLASVLSPSTATTTEENYRDLKELRHIYEKQETAIRKSEEKATWMSMGYVIFGAILYNTIVQSYSRKELLLLNRWVPISLLLSVSVAFWLQLVRTVLRFLGISHQSDISWMEQERMYHRLFMDKNGHRKISHDTNLVPMVSGSSSNQRYVYIFTVLSALFVFTLAVLHACLSILCISDAGKGIRQ